MKKFLTGCAVICLMLPLFTALAQESRTFGPDPVLPPPSKSLIPTVNIAKAIGWPENGKPVAAKGLKALEKSTSNQGVAKTLGSKPRAY